MPNALKNAVRRLLRGAPLGSLDVGPDTARFVAGFFSRTVRLGVLELRIQSVQIVRDVVLIVDADFYPHLGLQPHDIASVTKSVTSTLIGVAIDRELWSLDQVYRLEANQFDVRCVSLRFDSPSDVWFLLTVGSGEFDLPVGMDGVPRFSESGPTGIPVGVTGAWTAQVVPGSALSSCK